LVLLNGLAPLGFSLGINEIADRFCPRNVEPAVLDGPAGELPRLCQSESRDGAKLTEDRIDHG
jgi:hypothetical protein